MNSLLYHHRAKPHVSQSNPDWQLLRYCEFVSGFVFDHGLSANRARSVGVLGPLNHHAWLALIKRPDYSTIKQQKWTIKAVTNILYSDNKTWSLLYGGEQTLFYFEVPWWGVNSAEVSWEQSKQRAGVKSVRLKEWSRQKITYSFTKFLFFFIKI